jgi:hypothetical protein
VEVVRHPPHPRGEWVPHGDLQDWRTVWFSWQRLPPAPKVFRGVLPPRWVVEWTFAWLCQNRRFSRDYELHHQRGAHLCGDGTSNAP